MYWVHAENETTFTQDYKVIAKRLGLASSLDGPELLAAVREQIEGDSNWLMIFDNTDNLAAFGVGDSQSCAGEKQSLYDFVPRGPGGTMLWTSCDNRICGSLVGARRAMNVGSMTEAEARILLETTMCTDIDEELEKANELLSELDRLPLAVSQAAAYMRRTSTPIHEYLLRLRTRMERWAILHETEFDRHRRRWVPNSVLHTWDISIEHIRQENQLAGDILYSLAFVDNQNIPLELISKAAELTGKRTRTEEGTGISSTCGMGHGENRRKDDILAATLLLQNFSFLHLRKSDERNKAYEMHRLVQEATQYRLSQEIRRKDEAHYSEVALRALMDLFPGSRREVWEECEMYLEHAKRAADRAILCEGEREAVVLLRRVSDYLFQHGRWREMEPVDQIAYAYSKKAFGGKHCHTINCLQNQASTCHAQGRYDEAEKAKVEVLALFREVHGDKHPETIWSMMNLAATYYARGKCDKAEEVGLEAFALSRKILGEKHRYTIMSMARLLAICWGRGKYDEAEKMGVKVLALCREVLGEKHLETIQVMTNVSTIYHNQGKYDEAERVGVEVLARSRDDLGEKHPYTIDAIVNLAMIYRARGKYDEAEEIKVEALALSRDVLGEKHPDTIKAMANLAGFPTEVRRRRSRWKRLLYLARFLVSNIDSDHGSTSQHDQMHCGPGHDIPGPREM